MKVVTVELLDVGKKHIHDLADLPNILAAEVTASERNGWICLGGVSVIQRQRDDGVQTILMQAMTNNLQNLASICLDNVEVEMQKRQKKLENVDANNPDAITATR